MAPRTPGPSPRWLILAAVLCALPAGAAIQERTLYERLAGGPVVVTGSCLAEGRRAIIRIEEVLKGAVDADRIVIAYRMQNWERNPGDPKIDFRIGERCLLVLQPDRSADSRDEDEPLFLLAGGADGKVTVPAEGSEVLLDACRRIVRIQALGDQSEVWD